MNRALNRIWYGIRYGRRSDLKFGMRYGMYFGIRKLSGMAAGGVLLLLLAACGKQETQIQLQEYTDIPEAELSSETDSVTDAAAGQNTQGAVSESDIDADGSDSIGITESDIAATDTTGQSEIYVFICGHVQEPGVYKVPYGGRVCDGIALAGGLTGDADGTAVNQARLLVDGEKVYIPAIGEDYQEEQSRLPYGYDTASASSGNVGEPGLSGDDGSLVDINHASREELMTLPGIGETKAKAILTYRETHGYFHTKEDIMNIEGIKDGVYQKIESLITVSE